MHQKSARSNLCVCFALCLSGLVGSVVLATEEGQHPQPVVDPPPRTPPTIDPCANQCCWALAVDPPYCWLACEELANGCPLGNGNVDPNDPLSPTWEREWTECAGEFLSARVNSSAACAPALCGATMNGMVNAVYAGGAQTFWVLWNSPAGCPARAAVKELTLAGYAEAEVAAVANCSCLPGVNVTATAIGNGKIWVGDPCPSAPLASFARAIMNATSDHTWDITPSGPTPGPTWDRIVNYYVGNQCSDPTGHGLMVPVFDTCSWSGQRPFVYFAATTCNFDSLAAQVQAVLGTDSWVQSCDHAEGMGGAKVTSAHASANCDSCTEGPGGPPTPGAP